MNQVVTQWMQIDLASKITWPDLLTQVVRKFKIISAGEKKRIEKEDLGERERGEGKKERQGKKRRWKEDRQVGGGEEREEENCIKLD